MLKQTYLNLIANYNSQTGLADELWNEIESAYSGQDRHYHTLSHLENLLTRLLEVKHELKSWDAVLFAFYYHDVIYNPLKSGNEEKSAELAKKRMKEISVDVKTIEKTNALILATKSHIESSDTDSNYFTDADLSILGQSWNVYSLYCQDIRKEYNVYPDLVYKPGRKKVLEHFLAMERIFKTAYFHGTFEKQARDNMRRELEML